MWQILLKTTVNEVLRLSCQAPYSELIYNEQKSTSAWTQEAYCPPRSSTRYAILVGGTPCPGPRSGREVSPSKVKAGVPLPRLGQGSTPCWLGVPLLRPGKGVPPVGKDGDTPEGWRYPQSGRMGIPPPRKVEQTHACENITSSHPSDAGGNNFGPKRFVRSNRICHEQNPV